MVAGIIEIAVAVSRLDVLAGKAVATHGGIRFWKVRHGGLASRRHGRRLLCDHPTAIAARQRGASTPFADAPKNLIQSVEITAANLERALRFYSQVFPPPT
ncbi:hypothetical protein [Achromobacter ruhlandii]|uniref:hypothetical protein n=1 Tax=Achromobacter ruhlandii TaxID=72557 RepID=UPI00146BF76A|nr:hypothetical protein [Achromobacter ruhlandii]